MSTPPDDLIELGVLRGSYGLQGWVHIQPHTGDAGTLRRVRSWWLLPPSGLGSPTQAARTHSLSRSGPASAAPLGPMAILGVRQHGSHLVAKWQGCDTPEAAQSFKSWRIAVSRALFPGLPSGEFYWVDLVGMAVVNREGQLLGQVADVRSNGAHDLLEVRLTEGDKTALIPQVPAYVDTIDAVERRICVDWQADW